MADKFKITILGDGTIKSEIVGEVSKANHDNAETFLKHVAELAGGKTTRTPRPGAHHHIHRHEDGTVHQH